MATDGNRHGRRVPPLAGVEVAAVEAAGPAWEISLGRAEAFRLTAGGVLLLFLGAGVFSAVADTDGSTAGSVLLVVAFVATIVLHELVHAVCFAWYGGSPRFGAGVASFLPYVSTTCEGDRFDARQMSVIGLAPLVVLSVATLVGGAVWPGLAPYALVGFLANLSGSVGDIWLVAVTRRLADLDGVAFEDRAAGVAVWTDDAAGAAAVARLASEQGPAMRLFGRFAVATVVVFAVTVAIGLFATFVLPHEQAFRLGPAFLPLFEKEPAGSGVLVFLGLGPPVIAGLLFAVLSEALRRSDR